MQKLKKIISLILAAATIFSSSPMAYAAPKTLYLRQAINLTQQNFGDTKLKRIELSEKRIALTEAIEEIRNTRKEQRTIRFSLLFNLKFPEKTTLNKEQELISMVPSIENEIRILKKEIIDMDVEAEFMALSQYIKTYCLEQKLILEQKKYDQLKIDVEKTSARLKTGLADKDDLASLKTTFDKQVSTIANVRSQVLIEREELGRLAGISNMGGYALENPLVEGAMPREKLNEAMDYMMARDVDVFTGQAGVEYTSYCVQLLDDLYTQRWGGLVNDIRPYLYQDNVKPDFLLDKYEQLLANIDKPWEGSYKIWLIFFPIRLPKLWFKGSRAGQRYFSDGKYPLLTAVYDRDSAKEEYKQLVEAKRLALNAAFENMTQAHKAYEDACKERELNRSEYEKIAGLNKIGAASQGEVATAMDGYMLAQETELETLQNYNAQLLLFNRKSCGYLSAQVSKEVEFEAVGAGDSYKKEEKKLVGRYHITDVISGVTTSFTIELQEDFTATDYELWYSTEKLIGQRTAVTNETVHVASAFKGDEELILYLYNDGALVGKAKINQQLSAGDLMIEVQSSEEIPEKREKLGTFKITKLETDIISEITIKPENIIEAKSFNLSDKNGILLLDGETVPIDEAFVYASVGLMDPKELILLLYDSSNKLITKADMDSTTGEFYKRGEQN